MPAGMLEIWTGSVVLYVAMSPLLREYNTRLPYRIVILFYDFTSKETH